MPERVTFTRKSADRIAKVVKRVENMPSAEPIQQRRRAGGYRMESLWEVTAVDTGDEVVTLKRVQDTDDNLNDPSETEDVAYDLDDVPAVGNRGLIIRLGDGTRFFFRRGIGLNRTHIDEHAWIDEANPTTNNGYPTQAHIRAEHDNSDQRIGIFKFASVLPKTGGETVFVNLGNVTPFDCNIGGVFPSSLATFRLDLHAIKEDFDASAITWNDFAGLSKTTISDIVEVFQWNTSMVIQITMRTVKGWTSPLVIKHGALGGVLFDDPQCYGIALEGKWDGAGMVSGRFGGVIIRTASVGGKYLSWVEWDI